MSDEHCGDHPNVSDFESKKYLQYFFTMLTDLCIRKGENESNNVQ